MSLWTPPATSSNKAAIHQLCSRQFLPTGAESLYGHVETNTADGNERKNTRRSTYES